MIRKRRKFRNRNTSIETRLYKEVGVASLIRELSETLIDPEKTMTRENREAFQNALHDQTGKTMLHLSAIALHRQRRQAILAGLTDFILGYMSDPEYLKVILSSPETAVKFLSLLHKIDSDDTKYLTDLAIGTKKKEESGWDAKKSLNLIIGLVGANQANLPPALQNPHVLREFRNTVERFFDWAKGEDLPKPPSVKSRIMNGRVVDTDSENSD